MCFFFQAFMVKFAFAGSFGIALYRVLYVRKINFLMTAAGEKVVLTFVAVTTIGLSAASSWFYSSADATGRPGLNTCRGHSMKFEVFSKTWSVVYGKALCLYDTWFC